MLSSLISLYIAATMPPPIITQAELPPISLNISRLIETTVTQTPTKNESYISPIIEAKSSIIMDLNSDKILFEQNAHERLSIASITKLMTALVVLEENKLNEIVTVSENAATTEGSSMRLVTGEQIALENLLYGAIINSANDAAVALAEHNAGSEEEFIIKMNDKVSSLGLVNTHFSNPIGLDQYDNYSSSYDVAKLGKTIYQNQFIRHAASLKELEVKSYSSTYTHYLSSTNELLENSHLNIKGLKTGRTEAAGLCLISVAENDTNNEIITVVLNSPARFEETKILVDWTFRAYKW